MARIEGVAGTTDSRTALTVRRVIAYVVLILLVIISLLPFYLLIINATRGKVQTGLQFYPGKALGGNFKTLLSENYKQTYGDFFRSFANSLIIAAFTTVLSVYFSALTAYAIHVYDFKLKKIAHTFILIVMMVPTQASAIGLYRMLKNMNLLDSYIPLIVPAVAAPAVYFFMIQYMASSLPLEIVEAARIDGCGEFRTFNTIVTPILKPAFAVQGIFTFVSSWNNLFMPQMIIDTAEKKTIPLILQIMRANIQSNPMAANAGVMNLFMVLAILPVVVIYLILSKNIISGIALGSVKG
ncbi:carbohydrate ABC transporter permease [Ruminococcus sp. 210702-SL.1.03]|jgi:multiple sugar transport system permease protein|uniref:carbohydrate ABC transporter permease n=1 Tax=Ruminococcus sp. 210702-SL.1.03 TaxID=2883233 RepID=UPI001D077CEB|nr:carbohydrate ABC transporter permease [Ruminococcus sp. 210702-SL.1.03]MCB6615791.1 carbohydrate ABC transporter permease [Ruminococcus sp. 210702-SL.1.03]